MRSPRTARRWIWAALGLQLIGLAYDAIWHGLLHPGIEPQTRQEMIAHLTTVHLPLYIGVLSVFVTTVWALTQGMRERGGFGGKRYGSPQLFVALAGALLSVIGEAWHAVTHLRLDTHSAPVAGSLSPLGFVLVAAAVWRAGRRSARDAADRDQRRAA
jgi:hypothetical protein